MKRLALVLGAVVLFRSHGGATSRTSFSRKEQEEEQSQGAVLQRVLDSEVFEVEEDQSSRERRLVPGLTVHLKGQPGVTARAGAGSNVPVRDQLNGLVAESAAAKLQLSNIAFIKTHKTASTTLAYILFRYARRHHLKLAHFDDHNSAIPLQEAVEQTKRKGRCDIMHYHISVFGQYKGTWPDAEEAYRTILRDSADVNFVTVLREPRSHLLSYYSYFMQPDKGVPIEEFLMQAHNDPAHRRLFNPLSAEFGVHTREDLDHLVDTALPGAKLVILTEEFDEGLVVLRRLLGWEMMDITYMSVLKTADGAKRYDGKSLSKTPLFEDLPPRVQNKIDKLTELDRLLYNAAVVNYQKRRDEVAQYLEADMKEFEELQRTVQTYLNNNSSSKANVMYKTANIYAQEEYSRLHEF